MPGKLSSTERLPRRILIVLDRLHWLWLVLAAPFLLFPSPKRSAFLLIVPGLFLLHWLTNKVSQSGEAAKAQPAPRNLAPILPSTPLNGPLLLMMVMVLVSLWASNDISFSLPKVSGLVLGLGAFFAVVRESEHPHGWLSGLLAFIGIGSAIATLGILGTSNFSNKFVLFIPITSRLPRIFTGLAGAQAGINSNEVAGALTWLLPVMIAICIGLFFLRKVYPDNNAKSPKKNYANNFMSSLWVKILCLAVTGFLAAVFLVCQSRGAYFGLIITLIVAVLILLPPRWRTYCLALMALVGIALVSFLATHQQVVGNWLANSNLVTSAGVSLDTFNGRLEVWSRAIYGIEDFPFTGMGMNIFRNAVQILYPLPNALSGIDIGHAHNEFLQAALDLGIPGLIAFIAVYINAFWMLGVIWRTNRINPNAAKQQSWATALLVLGMAGGLFGHLFYGMTDAVALGAKPGLLLWILLGLICGLYRRTLIDKPMVKNNAQSIVFEDGAIE